MAGALRQGSVVAPLGTIDVGGGLRLTPTPSGFLLDGSGGLTSIPSSHAATHGSGGPDAITIAASQIGSGEVAVARGGTGVATAAANLLFAGPTAGAAAAPSFRALDVLDLPAAVARRDVANTFAEPQSVSRPLATDSAILIQVAGATWRKIWANGTEEWTDGAGTTDIFITRPAAGNLQIRGAAEGNAVIRIRAENTVGGAGGFARLEVRDAGTIAFQMLAQLNLAAGSRDVRLAAQSDRDGNRLPMYLTTHNAAGTSVNVMQLLAGADAGIVSIHGTATAGSEIEKFRIENRGATVGTGAMMSLRAGSGGVTTMAEIAAVLITTTTSDLIFRTRRAGTVTEAARVTAAGVLLVGTTVSTSATAGGIVIPNTKYLRGVNAAGTDTKPLVGLDASDRTEIGLNTLALVLASALTQTTVGAAGGASALPATPTKYWVVREGGTDYVIPLYAKA